MGMIDRIKAAWSALAASSTTAWPVRDGQQYGQMRFLLPGTQRDWEALAGEPWLNPVLAVALKWKSDRYALPRLCLSRINRWGEFVPIQNHPVLDALERPNQYHTRASVEQMLGSSLDIDGNAYLRKRRDRGRFVDLWAIPYGQIRPYWVGEDFITCFMFRPDGTDIPLPVDDVSHAQYGIDPKNPRVGISAIKAMFRDLAAVNMESTYTVAILENSGVPAVVFVPSAGTRVSETGAQGLQQRFIERFTRDRVGRPLVLDALYDIKALGFSPEQLAIDVLTRNATARICAAVNVAMMSLGMPDPNKTYANLAEANRVSWGGVVSNLSIIDAMYRWDVLPEFGLDPAKYMVHRDYSEIQELNESADSLHLRVRDDVAGGLITVDEGRELIGLEPMEVKEDEEEPQTEPVEDVEDEEVEAETNGKAKASRLVSTGRNGHG